MQICKIEPSSGCIVAIYEDKNDILNYNDFPKSHIAKIFKSCKNQDNIVINNYIWRFRKDVQDIVYIPEYIEINGGTVTNDDYYIKSDKSRISNDIWYPVPKYAGYHNVNKQGVVTRLSGDVRYDSLNDVYRGSVEEILEYNKDGYGDRFVSVEGEEVESILNVDKLLELMF